MVSRLRALFRGTTPVYLLISFLSSAFLAFGLYNVHAISGVTEGGVLGLTLLFDHHFGISPSVSGFIMNVLCYAMGFRLLGRTFLIYSAVSTVGFSLSYRVYECFPPLWPQIANLPLAAAFAGALFVGVGAGLCVRLGGAPGGDDALAMSLSHVTRQPIERIYLLSDLIVLLLSLTYIPLRRIAWSLLTVTLSGQLIGVIQRLPLPEKIFGKRVVKHG